jgi:hypothetical protein
MKRGEKEGGEERKGSEIERKIQTRGPYILYGSVEKLNVGSRPTRSK